MNTKPTAADLEIEIGDMLDLMLMGAVRAFLNPEGEITFVLASNWKRQYAKSEITRQDIMSMRDTGEI